MKNETDRFQNRNMINFPVQRAQYKFLDVIVIKNCVKLLTTMKLVLGNPIKFIVTSADKNSFKCLKFLRSCFLRKIEILDRENFVKISESKLQRI